MRQKLILKPKEDSVHKQVAEYLKWQYPKVMFRTDFAAGIKMTIGQAVKHKNLQKDRSWPDLFIAEPTGKYAGLFLELKREGTRLTKLNGQWATEHIREQAETLAILINKGYVAQFAVGFMEAKGIIDQYMRILCERERKIAVTVTEM